MKDPDNQGIKILVEDRCPLKPCEKLDKELDGTPVIRRCEFYRVLAYNEFNPATERMETVRYEGRCDIKWAGELAARNSDALVGCQKAAEQARNQAMEVKEEVRMVRALIGRAIEDAKHRNKIHHHGDNGQMIEHDAHQG